MKRILHLSPALRPPPMLSAEQRAVIESALREVGAGLPEAARGHLGYYRLTAGCAPPVSRPWAPKLMGKAVTRLHHWLEMPRYEGSPRATLIRAELTGVLKRYSRYSTPALP